MTAVRGFGDKVGFIWDIAELLRGDYKAHEFGQVILPLTVLRRLDCVLAPTKRAVLDRAAELRGRVDSPERLLLRTSGQPFYNTSPLDFPRLLDDAPNLAQNLRTYIAGFSAGAAEVLDRYGFDNQITRLDDAELLLPVVGRFADLDLHPDRVPNEAMGYVFEELLRRFSEASNASAGEHFTPREVIRLMVDVLLGEDDDALRGSAPVRTMFDCACGTGGMLTGGQDHLTRLNPRARLEVFGQELNGETWAIARSDLMIKGQDPARVRLGNSLSDDRFPRQRFDYMIANPPFGVDWEKIKPQLVDERNRLGDRGRFGAGLPRTDDGSFLFLQHLMGKMKPVEGGGSRIAIVFSGSPLFTGGAGSGESEIRRWIIENDWLEAVVALPDQLFYNTGISTYFWVVTNRKAEHRRGKVVLLDARAEWTKMRKSLGKKRKFLPEEKIAEVARLYSDALDPALTDERVKVFENAHFGYRRITVERPLRRRWTLTAQAAGDALATKPGQAAAGADRDALAGALADLDGATETDEDAFAARLRDACAARGLPRLPMPLRKAVLAACVAVDSHAPVATDRKGRLLPDAGLRDEESVPLTEDVDAYVQREGATARIRRVGRSRQDEDRVRHSVRPSLPQVHAASVAAGDRCCPCERGGRDPEPARSG